MAVPIGLITSAAGIAGGLLARRFRQANGAGAAAARTATNQAARHNIQLAKSNTANPNASMRNAMAANAQMGADLRGRGMAIDAQQAQRNAERETAFGTQTAALLMQGAGALGGGMEAFAAPDGGAEAASGAGTGALSQGPAQTGAAGVNPALSAIPGMGAAFSGQQQGGLPNPFTQMPGSFTSDEGIKREIRDAGFEVDEFLRALRDRRFQLRETGQEQTGVVAQELEDSQMGREMVSQGPNGTRQVDSGMALQGTMAGLGRLNERLTDLERRNQMLLARLNEARTPPSERGTTGTAIPISVIDQNPHIRAELQRLEQFRPGTTDEIAQGRIPAGNVEGMRRIAPNLFQKFGRHLTQTDAGDLPRATTTPPRRPTPRIQVR